MTTKLISTKLFLFIFALSFIVFLAHTAFTKTSVFSDGRFYYSITRSLVKDSDIKFANEYRLLEMRVDYTNKDYVWNKYPPGAPLFWIPTFYFADSLTKIINSIPGISVDTKGFGIVYQSFVAATSIFLGTLGLYLIYSLLKDYFSKQVSTLAVLTLFLATNLLFYIAVEPINSHAVSFFISAFFVYYFLKHANDKHYYFLLGIVGGIAGLVRTQDALILSLPIIRILATHKGNLKAITTSYILLATGAFGAFLPQIIFWKKIFNTFWYSPYLEEGFSLLKPQISHVLFNTQNGLFTTTPVVGIAFLSLILLLFDNKKVFESLKFRIWSLFRTSNFARPESNGSGEFRISLKNASANIAFYGLLYFTIQLYLVSSWSSFFQGGSYSIRMMISTYPLLVFGLAAILEKLLNKIGESKTLIIIGVFSAINAFLIIRYLLLF